MDTFSTSDANYFTGNGVGNLAAGRDFFQPFAANTIQTPQVGPPVLPTNNGGGLINFCKKNATVLSIFVLVLALAVAGFMVWQARKKASGTKGPFSADIEKIQDSERREDMKEWQYLWQLARRASVKQMLREVISNNVQHPQPLTNSGGGSGPSEGRVVKAHGIPPLPKNTTHQTASGNSFTLVGGGDPDFE
jgi:hypothetical protein